ncbi:antiviral reverse transcriptase Drt2 [Vibrio jasicida]|uniref:antiviral reverse transcriptase Drt2 n=1 Tax=Vibrio jasicida TaxID=766224 RepID=UPI0005EEB692|nr:antiviral reverse transcriptase Drt2 [Vibrio jasicida]
MERPSNNWYRLRSYLHFDPPISLKKATSIVTNPELVSRHAFYPLINYEIEIQKVSKDKLTKRVIKRPIKLRPIAYPAHLDSQIYSYYSYIISKEYENLLSESNLSDSILAFRKLGKSNIDFAFDAFCKIKDFGECSVVALDITGFFDNLNHEKLKKMWSKTIGEERLPQDHFNVYKSLTKYSKVDRNTLYKLLGISLNYRNHTKVKLCEPKEFRESVRKSKLIKVNKDCFGIPQGTPISAMLSNLYMLDFDKNIKAFVDGFSGKYFRYCDDILIISPQDKKDAVIQHVKKEIELIKLSINEAKTEVRDFVLVDGNLYTPHHLQYLGFMFDGKNIYLRSSSLARYSERMRRGVRLAKKTMQKYNKQRIEEGKSERGLYKKKLYSRYTHLGKRNFITYGMRASKKMDSLEIKKQLKPLYSRLQEEINKKL